MGPKETQNHWADFVNRIQEKSYYPLLIMYLLNFIQTLAYKAVVFIYNILQVKEK